MIAVPPFRCIPLSTVPEYAEQDLVQRRSVVRWGAETTAYVARHVITWEGVDEGWWVLISCVSDEGLSGFGCAATLCEWELKLVALNFIHPNIQWI